MTQPILPVPTAAQALPTDPKAAILRRLSVAGQKPFGDSDPNVAAFQYARGLPATGQVDVNTLDAGYNNNDPVAANPYVQAYAQYDMNDYNNGYGQSQGLTPEQLRQLQMFKVPK